MRACILLSLLLSSISGLTACSSKPVLPPEGATIRQIYDAHSASASSAAPPAQAPPGIRRDAKPQSVIELQRRFARLYNPTLHLYVYPHLAGTERLPVPGYYTVFPLYERGEYAQPGELIEP